MRVIGDRQVLDQIGVHDAAWGHQIFLVLFELVFKGVLVVHHQGLLFGESDAVLYNRLFLFFILLHDLYVA